MAERIVVTGLSGNVGSAVLRRLVDTEGAEQRHIVGIARRTPPADDIYASVEWHRLDLADTGAASKLGDIFRDASCVVHLAWGFQPTRNVSYLDGVGIGGSTAVLRAAHAAAVPHLVHMSSVGTYAAGRYGEKVDESWSTTGIASSAYSRAKSAVERLLDEYESQNPDGVGITRLRPRFIVQRRAATGLRRYALPAFVNPSWLRFLPVLPLDRSLAIPMVHADDVADACVRAIERRASGPFNLAAEPPVHRKDIAKVFGAKPIHVPSGALGLLVEASWRARLQPIDRGWLDLAFSVPLLDTERARTELGWTPQWSATAALADFYEGLLSDSGTSSPVLRPRSLTEALKLDVSRGPITQRPVP